MLPCSVSAVTPGFVTPGVQVSLPPNTVLARWSSEEIAVGVSLSADRIVREDEEGTSRECVRVPAGK